MALILDAMEKPTQQTNELTKTAKGRFNPELSSIISVLFIPAGLFIMLIDSSLPKAYKFAIIGLLIIGAFWVVYSLRL